MECYVCARGNVHQPAVALCKSCGAGLCLGHLRDTARELDRGSLMPTCRHGTWVEEPIGEQLRQRTRR
jgi:hypothetical protein